MSECILFLWRKQKQQLRWHRLRIIYCEWATSSSTSSSGSSNSLVSATHTNTKVASTQKIVKHQTAPSCASDTNTNATIVCIYLYRHTHTHTFMLVRFSSSSRSHAMTWAAASSASTSPTPTYWSRALNASYAQLSAAYLRSCSLSLSLSRTLDTAFVERRIVFWFLHVCVHLSRVLFASHSLSRGVLYLERKLNFTLSHSFPTPPHCD